MCVLFTLPWAAWNKNVMARAPAVSLDHEVTLEGGIHVLRMTKQKDGRCLRKKEMSPLFKKLLNKQRKLCY